MINRRLNSSYLTSINLYHLPCQPHQIYNPLTQTEITLMIIHNDNHQGRS